MNAAVWARVLPALVIMPLGPLPARLVAGAVLAAGLSGVVPERAFDLGAWVGEVALGALMGVVVSVPVWAAQALRGDSGPATLGDAGRLIAWATFFGMGGAGLWFAGLVQSFVAIPAGGWLPAERVVEATGALFYGVLLLGLPAWVVALWVAPTAAWIDRVGRTGLGWGLATAARPVLTLLVLAAALPLLLDVVRELWTVALGG